MAGLYQIKQIMRYMLNMEGVLEIILTREAFLIDRKSCIGSPVVFPSRKGKCISKIKSSVDHDFGL